jgi:Sec-independent protein translocase protein TatA
LGQAIKVFKKEVKEFKEGLGEESSAKRDTSNDFDPSAKRSDWRPKKESSEKNS